MADYFAVLQRTLSGFADPKPELRIKLYERARATIERQLQTRTPPVEGEALQAELQRLEQAIIDTERDFQQESVATQAPSVEPEQPVQHAAPPQAPPIPTYSAPQEPIEQFAAPEPVQETLPEPLVEPAPIPEQAAPPIPVMEPVAEAITEQPAALDPISEVPDTPPIPAPASPVAPQPIPVTDPVEEWAKEFLSNEPDGNSEASPVAAQQIPQFDTPAAVTSPPVPQFEEAPQSLPESEPINVPQVAESLPTFSTVASDDLSIPPAPGYTSRAPRKRKKRGILRWVLLILILVGLGFAGYFGWQSGDKLIENFGLQSWFDDPTRPKPVKTITIKPDPIRPEAKAPTKSETRLNAGSSDNSPVQPSAANPVKPPIAQNVVLYEVGGTASDNSIDAGRVVWSVVQEEPLPGLPKEPAIRARIEVPSRKLVLIMTIKRYGDKSVPASHLVELVFAVPDDFSGGAIAGIRPPLFKEQEQSQGAALEGVSTKVSDGIFWVALNNLDSEVKKNLSLMADRNWIDIPMVYRTGRQASLSIEKGQPGKQVFEEAFAAWAKL